MLYRLVEEYYDQTKYSKSVSILKGIVHPKFEPGLIADM